MNKILRNNIDVEVAFSSADRCQLKEVAPASSSSSIESALAKQRSKGVRVRIKATLRPVAQFLYHLVKPVLRPILFRFRRYITESLRQDIILEIQRASTNTHREVQAASESLRTEILNAYALLSPRIEQIEQYSFASARRVAINCGPGEVLLKTSVGYVLCSSTDHALLACLIETGELELGTRLLIQRFLSPGDVFVDVGANLGLHTLAAARSMQGLGKIIAFEPFEPTMRLLEKSVWMNGFSEITEIHQAAVSNHTGNQQLFLGSTSGHHSLFPQDSSNGVSLKPVEVRLVRLDEIILAGQKVDLIKIDAEGAELEVLESAAAVILSNPDVALIVEFGLSHLKRVGHTAQRWLEAFSEFELLYRVINTDTGALEDWSLEKLESTDSVNLFFARKDSKAWARATM